MMHNKEKVFVQIGTNDGNDEFNLIVKNSLPSKIILVEPNSELNTDILNRYQGVDNVFIENIAITTESGLARLVYPQSWIGATTTNEYGIQYAHQGFTLISSIYEGQDVVELFAPSITFNDLCTKYNITDIRYLQIDTEGYDYNIIKSIDFDKINIDVIKYEMWGVYKSGEHLPIKNLLENLGYSLMPTTNNIIAIKL